MHCLEGSRPHRADIACRGPHQTGARPQAWCRSAHRRQSPGCHYSRKADVPLRATAQVLGVGVASSKDHMVRLPGEDPSARPVVSRRALQQGPKLRPRSRPRCQNLHRAAVGRGRPSARCERPGDTSAMRDSFAGTLNVEDASRVDRSPEPPTLWTTTRRHPPPSTHPVRRETAPSRQLRMWRAIRRRGRRHVRRAATRPTSSAHLGCHAPAG